MTYQSKLTSVHPAGVDYQTVQDATVAWTYTDLVAEYTALRTNAALIDHGANGLLAVTGDALPFLNRVLTRDVEYLGTDRCMTSLVLTEEGQALDIVTVYGLEDGYLLESSTGRCSALLAHLQACADDSVDVIDMRDERCIVGIEGPYAWSVVGKALSDELTALPYESVVEADWGESPVLFARTGSTGEYGYKIIAEIDVASRLWETLVQDITPVGQAALEIAMVEVRQPIFHRELVSGTVLEAGANWLIDRNKEEFIGRDAVQEMCGDPATTRRIGIELDHDDAAALLDISLTVEGRQIGTIVHAISSPAIGNVLALAQIDVDVAAAGLEFECQSSDGTTLTAKTLSSPYVTPTSWGVPIF